MKWSVLAAVWMVVASASASAAPTAADCDDPSVPFPCARVVTARHEPQRLTIVSDWERSYVYGYSTQWQLGNERTFIVGACRFCKIELGCRAYGRAGTVRVVENDCGDRVRVSYRTTGRSPVRLTLRWSTLTTR